MAKMTIATSKIQEAIRMCENDPGVAVESGKTTTTIDLDDMPKEFLQNLMSTDLTKAQRVQIGAALGDVLSFVDQRVGTPAALHKIVKTLENPNEPTIEVKIGDRWHPAILSGVDYRADAHWGNWMSFQVAVQVCDQQIQKRASFGDHSFRDEMDIPCTKTVRECLEDEGVRITTKERVEEQKRQKNRAEQLRGKTGTVIDVHSSVLTSNKMLWYATLDETRLGTKEKPRTVIIEPDLEIPQNNGYGHHSYGYGNRTTHELPFVRAFSVDLKKYVYVHVDDLKEHTWATDARDRLVLPQEMRGVLDQIFDAGTSSLFADMFAGRHGGMVLLADGPTGVGKTLTAEVFAEHTKRPLYILEMGELGTNLAAVEENLQKVFARATRWNAVLLFDECDVFLAKREETDLERSAIVGVFLRLLDRYEGMFFLTSNRGEVIDPAFKGRITLKLTYPELDGESRSRVWQGMFKAAGMVVDGDIRQIAEEKINGRQIRNHVRLLKIMHPGGRVSVEQIRASFKYITK